MWIERVETWPSSTEALAALATIRLGRVSASVRALPVIVPVSFTLLDDYIAIALPQGESVLGALNGQVVAFEGGHFDNGRGCGWSVHVQGVATIATRRRSPSAAGRLLLINPQLVEGFDYRLAPPEAFGPQAS